MSKCASLFPQKVTDLEEKIVSLQNKCHLLEHTIADRDAQLQLARGEIQVNRTFRSLSEICTKWFNVIVNVK